MLKEFLNSLEDYCILYEKNDEKLIPILINKEEVRNFKPIENNNNWFTYQNNFYELIKNEFDLQGRKHILYQYHKNNKLIKELNTNHTDSLTELSNREIINQYLNKINKDIRYCVFGIMDIDFFKSINDNNGHLFGDQILSELGSILKMNKDCFDCIGRYGGEEFFFAIENKKINEVIPFLNQMKNKIEEYFATNKKALTVSIGISEYYKGQSVFEKVDEADKALYYVKENHRNNIAYKNENNEYELINQIDEENNHSI